MYGTPSPPQKVSGLVLKRGPKVGSKVSADLLFPPTLAVVAQRTHNPKK